MDSSLTLELWKIGLGAVVVVFGVAGLVLSILRWYLGTLSKGHRTLFNVTNRHTEQIAALEKFAVLVAPERAALFLTPAPGDFDKTVILEPK